MIFSKIDEKFELAKIDPVKRSALIDGLRRTRAFMIFCGVLGMTGLVAWGLILGSLGLPPEPLKLFNDWVPVLLPISLALFFWGYMAHQDIKMLILTNNDT